MKYFVKTILLLIFPVVIMAQDSVVTISPAVFDAQTDQAFIAGMNGWIFKEGNDTTWARKSIDISDWKKLKPTQLSTKYADKNGRVECWFRIKIRFDSTLGNKSFGIKLSTWAASDLYIDGNLIQSAGNTGINGKPFKEYSPFGNPALSSDMKAGNEYVIALHVVDYVSLVVPNMLRSEETGLPSLIRIGGPKYNSIFLNNSIKIPTVYNTIWIAVSCILSLLFWLLHMLNPFEKNLRVIALGSTFLALAMFFTFISQSGIGISYKAATLYSILNVLFIGLTGSTMVLILVNIFNQNVTRLLKVYLVIFLVGWIYNIFLPNSVGILLSFIIIASLLGVCIYYVISSWKNLKGAQWAIVVGLLLSVGFGLMYALTISTTYFLSSTSAYYISITGYSLSFPLSLLVYVSIRFKEIIKEVQQNAQQVVELSEEKKEQAINQQKILQEEVNRQTAQIRTTLENLKSTQAQLIQSEKMASLGELTTGIAHEIQNPLNFVNNFSEVNNELIGEMKEELAKGNHADAMVVAENIKQNLEKINHHGKRADAIVKGMLQHSRSSSGQKEPTDINALCDEYFRLAYHGLRAKEKSFNAKIETSFDPSSPKINVVPQDIGRVLLNLINNAFYAVSQKKASFAKASAAKEYEPQVLISTKKLSDKLEIRVVDNGNGIPDSIKEKIFQPFFTTKPTGQGTGLGLSLSYDIVKAHGGEIKVETSEGVGTTFIIQLPT